MARWGVQTRIKLLGGEVIWREKGSGWDDMAETVQGTKRRALDLTVPFELFQAPMLEQTRDVFAAEGLPQPWPELSPAYAIWKEQHYPGMPILRRTDRLFMSLTDAGSNELIWDVGPRHIKYGSRTPYWQYTEPVRPALVMLPATWQVLMDLVNRHVIADERRRSDIR